MPKAAKPKDKDKEKKGKDKGPYTYEPTGLCLDDQLGDVRLRSAEGHIWRVRSDVLKLASQVFSDIIANDAAVPDTIPLDENSQNVHRLLYFILNHQWEYEPRHEKKDGDSEDSESDEDDSDDEESDEDESDEEDSIADYDEINTTPANILTEIARMLDKYQCVKHLTIMERQAMAICQMDELRLDRFSMFVLACQQRWLEVAKWGLQGFKNVTYIDSGKSVAPEHWSRSDVNSIGAQAYRSFVIACKKSEKNGEIDWKRAARYFEFDCAPA